jgi:hypothetical protein
MLYEFYSEFDYKPKTTLPATALHIWKDRFWKGSIELPDIEILEFARECYFGGRTEAFSLGKYNDITVIDAASMYPWAMINGDLPVPWGTFQRVKKNDNATPKRNGIYKARIQSKIKIPILPIRTDEGLVFPNGIFEGSFVGEEIIYAKSIGADVTILSGIEFHDTCSPFDDYIQTFFKKKQVARGSKRLMYKLMMNALYGKFSQRGEHIVAETIEEFRELANPPDDFRIWNGLVLYEEEGNIPPWGNVVWSAIITARARIRLHTEMMKILDLGGRPLYCDTDSIAYINHAKTITKYPNKARAAGDFETRGCYKSILIVGKKEYALQTYSDEWIPYCKGIPARYREEYLLKGTATFVKPIKIRESTRRNINPNIWTPVTKTRHVSFENRVRNPDGTLAPIILNNRGNFTRGKRG